MGFKKWNGTRWENYTPKIWKDSANYFSAEFEQGSFNETTGELVTYNRMKIDASNRIRTKDLVLIDGESVLSINAGYRLFICYFDAIGRYYKSGDYYPGYTNWTTNPIYFPIGGHAGVPATISLAVSRTDNGAISTSDLPNIKIMLNHGSSPLPYEPPGTGWTAAQTYTYTNGAWVPDT